MKADMQPSLTAEGVAFARAIGSHESDARLRNPDYLAQHMLGPSYRFMATVPGIRFLARLNYERVIPGIYLYHIARTRHIDDLFGWEPGRAQVPLIALLGSEAPGRIEWALSQAPSALGRWFQYG